MLLGNPVDVHPAVPSEDIVWLDVFMKKGADKPIPFHNALIVLRRKLFPFFKTQLLSFKVKQ